MNKRGYPDEGEEDEFGNKRPREAAPPTFKFLAPPSLASAIQFSAGVIENASGGVLSITEVDDCYPGTDLQVVTLQGSQWERVMAGLRHVLSMVGNCSECLMPAHQDERRLGVVMPSKAVSALIGVKGANVRELEQRTGCHIHVDGCAIGFGPGGDRAVNINGGHMSLDQGLERAVGCVQEFSDQAWFTKWALRTNAERMEQEQAPPLRGQEPPSRDDSMGGGMSYGKGDVNTLPRAFRGPSNAAGSSTEAVASQEGIINMDGMGNMGAMMGMQSMHPMMAMRNMAMMNAMGGMMMMGMGGMGGMGSMGAMGNVAGMGNMAGMGAVGKKSGNNCLLIVDEDATRGSGGGDADDGGTGADLMKQVMDDMPDFVVRDPRGFVLRSAVPSRMSAPLQRKAGGVMLSTGTKIAFHGDLNAPARVMSIEGPLYNVCASYMLMMRRYIEVESAS